MTSPDPTAGTVLGDGTSVAPPVLGREALQAMVDAMAEMTTIPKLQSVILAAELWLSLAPHIEPLLAAAREAGREEGRAEVAKEIEAVGYGGQPMTDYWRGYVAATEKAVSIARGES